MVIEASNEHTCWVWVFGIVKEMIRVEESNEHTCQIHQVAKWSMIEKK
jgi:hypothetical protein